MSQSETQNRYHLSPFPTTYLGIDRVCSNSLLFIISIICFEILSLIACGISYFSFEVGTEESSISFPRDLCFYPNHVDLFFFLIFVVKTDFLFVINDKKERKEEMVTLMK